MRLTLRRFCVCLGLIMAASWRALPLQAGCAAPANMIEAENCLPGNLPAEWDLAQPNAGEPTLQGFSTDISVNKGTTVHFKIKSTASAYTINIYRIGYYAGRGARKVATVIPVAYPQPQPTCYSDSTGILDCGNWAESASWVVPSTAVTGTYIARLTRTDNGAASHIPFVVRDDSSHADILFQNSDSTWQAYNAYGGYSFYKGANTAGRAYKLSYNRPFSTRLDGSSYFFTHEYPTIRWLEANGYDVAYFTCVDTARRGGDLLNHKVFFSVGHDEYWSAEMRTAAENAQAAGVHMAFLSGNEIYWKTRWETSFDGRDTPHRTLTSFKESYEDAPFDPADPPTWTGTWEDARFSPPGDGGRPQNALTGQLYRVNTYRQDALRISSEDGKMRFWRNSAAAALAPGASLSYPEILGYEWDEDADNGFRPDGIIHLSSSTYFVDLYKVGSAGSNYIASWATHNLTLFKKPSGAIIFGAGTMQWAWGLENTHDHGSRFAPVAAIRQATVNLLADMGVQPRSLQAGLVAASPSTDAAPPASTITFPSDGGYVARNSTITITGTAVDNAGGKVGAVEVSVDGGARWHPAIGREQWTYAWFSAFGATATLKSRAIDDSLNIETSTKTVIVGGINPAPTLTKLTPASQVPGVSSFTLTVEGTGFIPGAVVRWNGSNRPTTFVSAGRLTAVISAADIASEGTALVIVFNPPPAGGASAAKSFIIGISCPCSIWPDTTIPSNASRDAKPLEVGVKFRSDVAGWVSAIRFYKTTFNTGPHTGHLWTRAGALLGSVTFSSETATGWQQAAFTAPIAISSNTTYVASYFTTTGYGVNQNYFTAAAADNAPLHGLKSGVDGLNALYKYSSSSAFPTDSYIGSNYWVDLVFIASASVSAPVPELISIMPRSGAVGSSSFTLTAAGSGFVPNKSIIQWNGSPRTTVYVSSSILTTTMTGADLASAGSATVRVFTPAPGGGVSAPQIFSILVPNPVPSLNSVYPSSTTAGGPGFTITAYGSGFFPGSIFQWNGGDRPTTFINDTTLTASIIASDLVSSGTRTTEVFNPSPGGGASPHLNFIVGSPNNPSPAITGISPSSATAGSAGFTLTVTGGDFISTSTVRWNGADRPTVFVSSAQITASIPASDLLSTGTAAVTVRNPPPGGGISSGAAFTVNPAPAGNPVPAIAGISPSSATAGSSAFTLQVNGSQFISSSTVRWNGVSRATVFVSSVRVSAAITASDIVSAGTATVTVFNLAPGGGTSNAITFTIAGGAAAPAPVLSSISPTTALVGGSTFTLTATGTNFVPGSVIRWNGVARATTFVSTVALTTTIFPSDLAARSYAYVTVFTPAPGGGLSISKTFTIRLEPAITSLFPSAAAAGSAGFTLTVNGAKFVPDSIVRWNAANRTTVFVSSVQLTASLTAADVAVAGPFSVTVFNPSPGGYSPAKTFTVTAGAAAAAQALSTARATYVDFAGIRIYPNPWRGNIHAAKRIIFDQMPAGTTVKIFTVSGRWVATLNGAAGSADWDLKNDHGDLVASGYYIYLATTDAGEKRHGVFAIIR